MSENSFQRLRSKISMGAEEAAQLESGWHKVENPSVAVRWTDGCGVAFMPNLRCDMELKIQYLVEKPLFFTKIYILADGKLLDSFYTELGLNEKIIPVPADISADEKLRIEILSKPFYPKRLLKSSDTRRLGVMIHRIEIEKARESIAPAEKEYKKLSSIKKFFILFPRLIDLGGKAFPLFLFVLTFPFAFLWSCIDCASSLIFRRQLEHKGRIMKEAAKVFDLSFQKRQLAVYDNKDYEKDFTYHDLEKFKTIVEEDKALAEKGIFAHLGLAGLKELMSKELLDSMKFGRGDSVLDVGCLGGSMLNSLHILYGTRGCGIDISFAPVQSAKKINPFKNKYLIADAVKLPFKDSSFDKIISFDVLEHIPMPMQALKNMAGMLKRGGAMLLYAMNRQNEYTYHWLLRKLSKNRYGLDIESGHDVEYFLYADDVRAELERNNLKVEKIAHFHSFFTLIIDEVFGGLIKKSALKTKRSVSSF